MDFDRNIQSEYGVEVESKDWERWYRIKLWKEREEPKLYFAII